MSSVYFHPDKQQWVYGKQIIETSSGLVRNSFQELAPQGHKRGKPIPLDSKAIEKGLLIRWEQLFYERHHGTIQQILGFRFDSPSGFPKDLELSRYKVVVED